MERVRRFVKQDRTDIVGLPRMLDQLHEGDCKKFFPLIPDWSIDLVFADPPFNIDYEYDLYDDLMEPRAYMAWCAEWLRQSARVLKPTGHLWVAISEEYVSELKVLAEGRFALDEIKPRPKGEQLRQRHHAIWHYTFGQNAPKKLTRSKTHLLHFCKRAEHKWNEHAVRVPSARQVVYGDKRANPDGRLPDDTWILRPQEAGFAGDHDCWHFPRICGTYKQKRETPNQMPEQLLGRIIRLTTDPGDVVLDPFAGSGTTAAVSKKLGRHFITFEMSPAYALQAGFRLSACKEGDMLDGPDAGDPAPPPG